MFVLPLNGKSVRSKIGCLKLTNLWQINCLGCVRAYVRACVLHVVPSCACVCTLSWTVRAAAMRCDCPPSPLLAPSQALSSGRFVMRCYSGTTVDSRLLWMQLQSLSEYFSLPTSLASFTAPRPLPAAAWPLFSDFALVPSPLALTQTTSSSLPQRLRPPSGLSG